ncbi:hypothetical protein Tco_0693595 [Tanacetum coccineum]
MILEIEEMPKTSANIVAARAELMEEMDTAGNGHDDFVDINDKGYKERMCKLLDMTYKKPSLILIEKVEVTRYTIGPGESYTKVMILEIEEMPKTSANIVAARAELMEEMDTAGSVQRETKTMLEYNLKTL